MINKLYDLFAMIYTECTLFSKFCWILGKVFESNKYKKV